MKNHTCCFTGHRRIPAEEYDLISAKLETTLVQLVHRGYQFFGAGGALGFDTLAAMTVLKLKKDYSHIKLILVLPCRDQASRWKASDAQVYEYIKGQADKVVYISEDYTAECMFRRNRHLVDNSSVCIAYCTKEEGGTAYTVAYAGSRSVRIINLAENQA